MIWVEGVLKWVIQRLEKLEEGEEVVVVVEVMSPKRMGSNQSWEVEVEVVEEDLISPNNHHMKMEEVGVAEVVEVKIDMKMKMLICFDLPACLAVGAHYNFNLRYLFFPLLFACRDPQSPSFQLHLLFESFPIRNHLGQYLQPPPKLDLHLNRYRQLFV